MSVEAAAPLPGLADPVRDAQRAFRAALEALSRPGRVHAVGAPIAGLALGPALSHLLLALADEDTPVWWQQPDAALQQWLRFHTGARVAASPREAAFAVVRDAQRLAALDGFTAGSLASPEGSCTLIVELPSLAGGPVLQAHGPGIRERQAIAPAGLPERFWAQWQANHAAFPQGVDVFFTCGDQVMGLPRTTRISRLEGV
ncbi:phosphonate C-P lyase system protein PhnH [Ramlibacter tataouinensis]|uniref:Candidate PhnH protein n=1 Tax=Ramlibacter tataouinensis (strain ATCC BAA-407 / DSM 14655 / LMG 21543 / TTB310) TaxID=365046 RepID=F5XZY3_RAMTT|nr:phosphonate C-P lyase system protein PhnH [Ramlibacter tataouinensis]AEG93344.1 Candidate PhnH protein [Ramlibacter tataouinensis TTB310]